ncbi:AC9 transposase [Ceratobasidium sp. AG-Ba]|nr:AC9 transposase [Ceratobasidium sp. AG-Ba]
MSQEFDTGPPSDHCLSSGYVIVPTPPQASVPSLETPLETNSIMQDAIMVDAPAVEKAPKKRSSRKRKKVADSSPSLSRLEQAEVRANALESIISAAEALPPTMVVPKAAPASRALYSSARDVFYWVRPVETSNEVNDIDVPAEIDADRIYQESLSFSTLRHPKSPFLRCICCLRSMRKTQTWVNQNGGLTACLRNHMEKYHPVSYYGKCQQEGLAERCTNMTGVDSVQPEWTHAGLIDRLVDLVVSNDEPLSLVETPEFRDLILYCGQGRIHEQDVPHRDKLATAAWAMYLLEKGKIDEDMKQSRGRISLTSDLWSDANQRSFMAVTAHYINERGSLQDHLISFRKIDGEHTGANIAQALFQVLQESDIVGKVGWITLDNASNNDTLMEELATSLKQYGAEFDPERNRIRHAIINALKETAANFRAQSLADDLPIDDETEHYLQALESNPVNVLRESVTDCRSSGQRREGLRNAILEGNRLGRFRTPGGEPCLLPAVQLLRDVPTRWSSTHNMIRRYLELYPAVADYALRSRHEFQLVIISHKQYEVLQDVLSVLTLAHNAQELLSAEKTPTLALAFPVYETVIEAWDQLCIAIPELSYAITCGISKIRKYIDQTQGASVHALSMIVNPALKLSWIQEHWTPAQASQAEATIKSERALSLRTQIVKVLNGARHAAQAQTSGYMRLLTAGATLRRASGVHAVQDVERPVIRPCLGHQANTRGHSIRLASGSATLSATSIQAFNQAKVDAEFARYIEQGVVPVEEMDIVELVSFWKDRQHTYPLLYRIAMDVLPVQASSVSSERVFSSSKLTCVAGRNRITPENMEYLQVLKHALHRRRRGQDNILELDFVSGHFESLSLGDD